MLSTQYLMNISHAEWNAALTSEDGAAWSNYNTAFLLAYYFIHLDGEKQAERIRRYLDFIQGSVFKL